MSKNLPYMKSPCDNCPFRKDGKAIVLDEKTIKEKLQANLFLCHKAFYEGSKEMQCAGHMIIKGEQNAFVALAKRFFRIDLELKDKEIIFDNENDCIKYHSR